MPPPYFLHLHFAGDSASIAQEPIAQEMKPTIWTIIALLAARGLSAQAAHSPASLPPPKTVTPQTYPVEQIQAGELRFTSQCGFCHGRDAAGGETGPDLTRSALVAEDTRGDKIGPLLRRGTPGTGHALL